MNLLANTLVGGLYLILLFALCFSVVVGVKALKIELRNRQRQKDTPTEAEEEKPDSTPKPREKKVYYIVEKKRTKSVKQPLGKPKRIEFRD